MEKQAHARSSINGADLLAHQRDFKDRDIIYLSIENNGDLAGFFILALSHVKKEVECRRVLIEQHHRGIGQLAIIKMENYCSEVLCLNTIWLDVYEDNVKGIHIYEKLGYKIIKQDKYKGRNLLYYQKTLNRVTLPINASLETALLSSNDRTHKKN